jgi:hypothetical protein
MRLVCALATAAFISGSAAASPPEQSSVAAPPVYFNHVTIYVGHGLHGDCFRSRFERAGRL